MDVDDVVEERSTSTNGCDWASALPKDIPACDLPMRDISQQAVWTLSSCKTEGNGIHELLHDSVDKYWQSDGPQPHTVTIEFQRKTDISFLMLYLDFKNDESYTPSKIIVHLGSSLMHLDDGLAVGFNEPIGWQVIDLRTNGRPSRAMAVQLQVVHNHQNGRDTHIRHIRLIGPSRSRFTAEGRLLAGNPRASDDFRTIPLGDLNHKMMCSMVIR